MNQGMKNAESVACAATQDPHGTRVKATGTRRHRRLLAPALAILAMGLVGLVEHRARAAAPSAPFESLTFGKVSVGSDSVHFQLEGAGIASTLGVVGYQGAGAIETTDPANGDFTDGLTETLSATGGDTLTIRCQQSAVQLSPGLYKGTDQWTVVGGTGRFRGAMGSGTGSTLIDLNLDTFTKAETGTVRFGN